MTLWWAFLYRPQNWLRCMTLPLFFLGFFVVCLVTFTNIIIIHQPSIGARLVLGTSQELSFSTCPGRHYFQFKGQEMAPAGLAQ